MISIIVPVFNRESIIIDTLESIKQQTNQNWECIIVDDFSTDNTKKICKDYIKTDVKFKFIENQRSKGAQGARNTGIIYSNYDFVFLFDSDDLLESNCIDNFIKCILEHKNVDIFQCYSNNIDRKSKVKISEFNWDNYGYIYPNLITWKTYATNNNTIVRKSKLLDIGLLSEDCPSFQEYDTHLKLSKISNYYTIKKHLTIYNLNGNDTISVDKTNEIYGLIYIYNKYRIEMKLFYISYLKISYMCFQKTYNLKIEKSKKYSLIKKFNFNSFYFILFVLFYYFEKTIRKLYLTLHYIIKK